MAEDYYQILGVLYDASQDDIKMAYRQLAKTYHPDVNNGDTDKEDQFKRISEAYETLSNVDKKSSYDLWLLLRFSDKDTGGTVTEENWTYQEPVWPQYKTYTRKPVTYSKRTYTIATILVAILFISIFLTPIFLAKYSSVYHYKKAVESYQLSNYYSSLTSADHAIVDFGKKSEEACLLTSVILMEQYQQYNEAILYTEKGLERISDPKNKAIFYYVKALCLKANGNYDSSLVVLNNALQIWRDHSGRKTAKASPASFWPGEINQEEDSLLLFQPAIIKDLSEEKILYSIGEIEAFSKKDYNTAIKSFNELLTLNSNHNEAYYGRAYCWFNLDKPAESISDINIFINNQPDHAMAYFLRGKARIQLDSLTGGCADLQLAHELGVKETKKTIEEFCQPR